MIHQVKTSPLPSIFQYEDRNSLALTIKSLVPFIDYGLIEFTLGLPEKFVLRRSEHKYILRKAFDAKVNTKTLVRKDKKGFVFEEEQ